MWHDEPTQNYWRTVAMSVPVGVKAAVAGGCGKLRKAATGGCVKEVFFLGIEKGHGFFLPQSFFKWWGSLCSHSYHLMKHIL